MKDPLPPLKNHPYSTRFEFVLHELKCHSDSFISSFYSDSVRCWNRLGHVLRGRRGAVVEDNCVSQHLSGGGSSPAGSVGRDLNLQKLNYQYFSVAVVLVVRWYFNG